MAMTSGMPASRKPEFTSSCVGSGEMALANGRSNARRLDTSRSGKGTAGLAAARGRAGTRRTAPAGANAAHTPAPATRMAARIMVESGGVAVVVLLWVVW